MNEFRLSDAQIELLQLIDRYGLKNGLARPEQWEERNSRFQGTVNDNVNVLIQQEFLNELSPAAILAERNRKAELEQLCSKHGIDAIGTKRAIAERLVSVLSQPEIEERISKFRRYKATVVGKDVIDRYRNRREAQHQAMVASVTVALRQGDAKRAAELVEQSDDEFENTKQVFDSGILRRFPERRHFITDYLLHFTYHDLPYDEGLRREIGVQLALGHLLVENHFGFQRILDLPKGQYREFSCPELETWLRQDACGFFSPESGDEVTPALVAAAYSDTRFYEAHAAFELRRLLDQRLGKGVEIFPAQDPCRICNRGKLKYQWSEIAAMPRIPRHWGCRCLYLEWL